jgi:hypothetical protein
MKRTQLQRQVRDACHLLLPSWFKYRKGGLYRRTEDFVQWLYFDIVEYRIALRPFYSVQALAAQIPAVVYNLGIEVRSPNGFSTWIEPEMWLHDRVPILDYVIQQVKPPPEEPLNTESILQFVHLLDHDHQDVAVAKGIASIALGDFKRGYAYLIFAQTERISIQLDIIHANRGRFYSKFEPKRPEQYLSKQIISSSAYGCEASNSIRLSCPDSK